MAKTKHNKKNKRKTKSKKRGGDIPSLGKMISNFRDASITNEQRERNGKELKSRFNGIMKNLHGPGSFMKVGSP